MRDRHPVSWLLFFASGLTAIALFFIPAFIIQPFRQQSVRGLDLAMALRQRGPLVTLAAAIVCLACAALLWREARRAGKIVVSAVVLLAVFSTVMARLNYFEWMFHPVDSPAFEAENASKLNPDEMVLAIAFRGDARAYPVSQMAYHHIVNDTVGGVPVAVTY